VVHLLRNSFRYPSSRDWAAIAHDLKLVYTAASESAALDAFAAFSEKWEKRYPAIVKLCENPWAEFIPFLAFHTEIIVAGQVTDYMLAISRLTRSSTARNGSLHNTVRCA